MQKNTTRGVQESDVWAAADALIAQGLRPTIERVRQQIGRGSPNTVSPMLETWFATLGQRLGVAGDSGHAVPSAVPDVMQRLAQELWEHAQAEALTVADAALQQRSEALESAVEQSQAREEQLVQREASLLAQKQAMDQALQLSQAQSQDLARRLDEMQQQVIERDTRLEEMREALGEAGRQRELLLEQHRQELQVVGAERQRLAEQYAGNERHMLNEVDRARQELTAARKTAAEQERKAQTRQQELQAKLERSDQDQLQLHGQYQAAQNAAAIAQERVADLKSLLDAQQRLVSTGAAEPVALAIEQGGKRNLSLARRAITRTRDRRTLR